MYWKALSTTAYSNLMETNSPRSELKAQADSTRCVETSPKCTITERALYQRINRKLKHEGGQLRTARSQNVAFSVGRYFTVNMYHNYIDPDRFGETRPEHYLFPAGECWPNDPTQPSKRFKTAWGNLRKKAGVQCRIHDLRHTAITKLAESGASDSTIMALAGHLSRAMMEPLQPHPNERKTPSRGILNPETQSTTDSPKFPALNH